MSLETIKITHNFEGLIGQPLELPYKDQINTIIEKLAVAPHFRRAQATTWVPWVDNESHEPPCLQRIWCRLVRSEGGVYLLEIADKASERSTCDRLHVGALLVRDRTILSTGYNGAPRGTEHCGEVGHRMIEGHCRRTVHAEVNTVAQAAREGTSTKGSTLYTNYLPCENCVGVLINAGVARPALCQATLRASRSGINSVA